MADWGHTKHKMDLHNWQMLTRKYWKVNQLKIRKYLFHLNLRLKHENNDIECKDELGN